jgi:phenylacetate-CoA ligase
VIGSNLQIAFSRKNAWALLPAPMRKLVGSLFAHLPQERVLGRHFREARAFIQEAQWWPAERARQYQLDRMQALCARAYDSSAYYRRAFQAAGFVPGDLRSLDDVARLPLLDRATIRAHTEELLTVSRLSPRLDAVSTGGTSGAPLHFFIGSDRSDIEYAYLTAGWERAGFDLQQQLAVLKGDVVAPDRHGLRHDHDPLLRRHRYSTFHLSEADIERYLAHMATLGPCFLLAYPSVIASIARFASQSGAAMPPNVRGIIAESETVYEEQRAFAERTLGCRYFSLYGLTEKVVAAAECERSTDYHVWPTYGFFELLDDSGRAITEPGRRGEIVGTSFLNNVMPFIRYRTGDFATYIGERCSACGREHTTIREVRGHRTQESLVAHDGSLVPWSALNMHDDTFLRVTRFQFAQETPGRSVLRVVPGPGFTAADRERVLRNLKRKLDGRVELTIEITQSLPVTARGKAIYVDQRIAAAQDPDARIA